MKYFVMLAALLFAPAYALGAPWTFESFDTGQIVINSADQISDDEEYYLVVECTSSNGWSIWVESPFDWEPDANYASEAVASFTMDGVTISQVKFIFDDRQWGEGIAAFPAGQEKSFHKLVDALELAKTPIEMRYFDCSARFSPQGSTAAIRQVKDVCQQ